MYVAGNHVYPADRKGKKRSTFLDRFVFSAEDVMFYSSRLACLSVSRRSHQIMNRFLWHLVHRSVSAQETIHYILILIWIWNFHTAYKNNKRRGWIPNPTGYRQGQNQPQFLREWQYFFSLKRGYTDDDTGLQKTLIMTVAKSRITSNDNVSRIILFSTPVYENYSVVTVLEIVYLWKTNDG